MIACVGAGSWGRNLVRTFADLGVLSWVCDLNPGIRADVEAAFPAVQTTASFDDVLNDAAVTAVVLGTPAETHAALTRRALLAGRDVFVEKPLALSLHEAEELVELASRANRVLMVGHLLWYHPAVVKLKALIDAGELGRIQYIYSNRLNLGRIRREENILWSFAPHDISVILGLAGEMPHAVDAFGGNYLREQIADVTVSLLAFPSGVKAHIFVSWLHPYKEQKLIVVGDRKMAVFNDMEAQDKLLLYPHTINWTNQLPVPSRADAQVVADRAHRAAAERMPAFPGLRPDPADAENGRPGSDSCADGARRVSALSRGGARRRRRGRPRLPGRSIPSTRRRSSTTTSRSARGRRSGTSRT